MKNNEKETVKDYVWVIGIKFHKKMKCFALYLIEKELSKQRMRMQEFILRTPFADLVDLFNKMDIRQYYDLSIADDYPQYAYLLDNENPCWKEFFNEEYKKFELLGLPVFSADEFLEDSVCVSEIYIFDIDNRICQHTARNNGSVVRKNIKVEDK